MTLTTLDVLEKKLWAAADILRGTVDSGDYKNYIFTLLALKRLNDVYLEEVAALKAKGYDDSMANDPDFHAFYVPETARWNRIPEINKSDGDRASLGEAINIACDTIEKHPANASRLENVLTITDFNDTHKLGDERRKRIILKELYDHFSAIALGDKDLEDPDILGRAYEYLIKEFAEGAGKKGGEFFTPPEVVQLMVEIVKPQPGMRILDPTVGSGGFLIRSARYVREHVRKEHGESSTKDNHGRVNLALYGQEANGSTWAICKLNMLLHGHGDARIERGDSIREPKLLDEKGGLIAADRVLANPPFSLDKWGHESWEQDPHGRNVYGTPPKTKGDWAFIQHMLAHCSNTGMIATVVPHGVLFRGGSEGKIRQGVLKSDYVEAVIGLGPNIFYGTGIPAAIVVLNKAKAPERKNRVVFINASEKYRKATAQNYLDREHIDAILTAFERWTDVAHFSHVVTAEEIEANEFSLNITRYVDTTPTPERVDLKKALKELKELEQQRNAAEAEMHRLLGELGYEG